MYRDYNLKDKKRCFLSQPSHRQYIIYDAGVCRYARCRMPPKDKVCQLGDFDVDVSLRSGYVVILFLCDFIYIVWHRGVAVPNYTPQQVPSYRAAEFTFVYNKRCVMSNFCADSIGLLNIIALSLVSPPPLLPLPWCHSPGHDVFAYAYGGTSALKHALVSHHKCNIWAAAYHNISHNHRSRCVADHAYCALCAPFGSESIAHNAHRAYT